MTHLEGVRFHVGELGKATHVPLRTIYCDTYEKGRGNVRAPSLGRMPAWGAEDPYAWIIGGPGGAGRWPARELARTSTFCRRAIARPPPRSRLDEDVA